MLKRWRFYLQLGWLDLVRLWPTTRHHAIIVAGICLPILMLLGIKRGHVAELRRDLVTSPIGRQVTFWSSRKGELMDRAAIDRLSAELPSIDLIIPETQRYVRLFRPVESEVVARDYLSTTVYATKTRDPQLIQLGIEAPLASEREIIISETVAKALQVAPGELIELWLTRGRDDHEEEVSLDCRVRSIIPTEQQNALIAYMDLDLLDAFEQYVRGQRVESLNWPSANHPARDCYSSYLIFCETTNDLTAEDEQYLAHRGFLLEDCTEHPPAAIEHLLAAASRQSLRIYQATTTELQRDPVPRLQIAPSEISEQTHADDVVLPWNSPAVAVADGENWTLVGISLPRRTWLREYFRKPDLPFDYDAEPFQARTMDASQNFKLSCQLSSRDQLDIDCESLNRKESLEQPPQSPAESATVTPEDQNSDSVDHTRTDSTSELSVAVVPANLAAWLAAHRANLVEFDPSIRLFVPLPQSPVYDRARLYAKTIDDVPTLVRLLTEKNFAVMSETGRIAEIHRQDRSLQLLVWVVGLSVFLFGVVTIISVLMDSTDRKRGTIGILRVMGMSPGGIFISILLRSAAIGLLAALISLVCGYSLALALEWKPSEQWAWMAWKPMIQIEFNWIDMAIVATGALVCCGAGALPPAWKASRLDPFDAIVEGRFR